MKYVYLTLSWVFGILFGLSGLLSMIESPLAGICLVAISLLLLPPIRNSVFAKTNKEYPFKARAASIFVLLIAFVIFVGQSEQKKAAELEAQKAEEQAQKLAKERQENIDYFNANKAEILASASSALSENNYQVAIDLTRKYLPANDRDLNEIYNQAKNTLGEIRKAEREKKERLEREAKTNEILAQLKTIPASELEENKKLYQQLARMHPSNEKYKAKLAHYTAKIEEGKQAKIAAEARKKRIERQFSAWDGSHNNLERLIKKAMNDPASYEHDETVYWDRGDHLVVRTTYRGKNAFGGVVRNFVKAKVSLDGEILQILDQT